MLATSASGPLTSVTHGYEVKWEGLRVLAGLEGSRLTLRTAAGQDPAFWLPDVEGLRAAADPDWLLLDGEVVVIRDGLPSPPSLQQRLQAQDAAAVRRLADEAPVTLMLYDILRIGDSWLLDVNWEERREILSRAIRPSLSVRLPQVSEDGTMAMTRAAGLGLDSVVAKRRKGRYYPGERTREWITIRPMEVLEAVICGWTEGRGARSGAVGTLLLGAYQSGELVYVGHTGTGLDAESLRILQEDLVEGPEASCPFRESPSLQAEPHWVAPRLAVRVRHQGWSDTGKMRSPTFIELAPELEPRDCRLPEQTAKVASG